MGAVQKTETRHVTARYINTAAFAAALTLHILILTGDFDLGGLESPLLRPKQTELSLVLEPTPQETQADHSTVSDTQELTPVIESVAPKPIEPIVLETESTKTTPVLQSKLPTPDEPSVVVPTANISIDSDVFQKFLRTEAEQALNQNPEVTGKLADSFIAPPKPDISDTDPKVGSLGGPLGGGSFKFRKNGVQCSAMKSVPQTFDELSGAVSTISTVGNCKNLNKKIDLLDENGQIKNSDRYDWP